MMAFSTTTVSLTCKKHFPIFQLPFRFCFSIKSLFNAILDCIEEWNIEHSQLRIHLLVVGPRNASMVVNTHIMQAIQLLHLPCNFRIYLTYSPFSLFRKSMPYYEILYYAIHLD